VGVAVGSGVGAAVGVAVGTGVPVGAAVGVGVGADVVTTSKGEWVDSRLARLIAVLSLSVRARLIRPRPDTSEVTSMATIVPVASDPDAMVTDPTTGALLDVVVISAHVLFATE
jgi:hypothetical protein